MSFVAGNNKTHSIEYTSVLRSPKYGEFIYSTVNNKFYNSTSYKINISVKLIMFSYLFTKRGKQ